MWTFIGDLEERAARGCSNRNARPGKSSGQKMKLRGILHLRHKTRANLISLLSREEMQRIKCRRLEFSRNSDGNGKRRLRTGDGTVERIALHRFAPRLADKTTEFFATHALWGGGAGIVINLLFHH